MITDHALSMLPSYRYSESVPSAVAVRHSKLLKDSKLFDHDLTAWFTAITFSNRIKNECVPGNSTRDVYNIMMYHFQIVKKNLGSFREYRARYLLKRKGIKV